MLEIIKYQADLKCQTHLKYMLIFILYMYFSTASIYLEHRENLYYTLITKTKEKNETELVTLESLFLILAFKNGFTVTVELSKKKRKKSCFYLLGIIYSAVNRDS